MSLVFNTNLPRKGIDWRLFSPENTSQYQAAINANTGRTLSNLCTLVSSPFSSASSVSSVLLNDGNLLCSGNEGIYTFNPTTLQFTYKSNNRITKMYLLDSGNVLCTNSLQLNPAIINPNDGSYITNENLTIKANKIIYIGTHTISSGPQTFTLGLAAEFVGAYIVGTILNVKDRDSENSFTGTITSMTSNSITIQKSSQVGSGTFNTWDIIVVGQTSNALNTFKISILNFQKLPTSFYVLTDSSFDRDAYIDPINWTVSFTTLGNNPLYKSSSKYSADTLNGTIKFPETAYTKIISTRSTNAYAMADTSGTSLKLVHPGGTITNSSTSFMNNIFCLLPQINSTSTNQAQGIILLWVALGQYQTWNTENNTITTSFVSGSAPDIYNNPIQLLDGRIFLQPFPNSSNPSSFLIFGGTGGFNPNITLSAYFNKFG